MSRGVHFVMVIRLKVRRRFNIFFFVERVCKLKTKSTKLCTVEPHSNFAPSFDRVRNSSIRALKVLCRLSYWSRYSRRASVMWTLLLLDNLGTEPPLMVVRTYGLLRGFELPLLSRSSKTRCECNLLLSFPKPSIFCAGVNYRLTKYPRLSKEITIRSAFGWIGGILLKRATDLLTFAKTGRALGAVVQTWDLDAFVRTQPCLWISQNFVRVS